jgi:two-component system KDP operon response regulator KdpE
MSRVLVIEDSPPLTRVINWILTEAGHDVSSILSPQLSAERARAYQPNVVVFNTGMPDTEKTPYIDEIRRAAPDARIIDLSTDSGRRRDRAAARASAGDERGKVDVYLRIPFHADDLLRAVDELASRDREQ